MHIPWWVRRYFQKQPKNFTGQFTLTFQDGTLAHVERRDKVTEHTFFERYGEVKADKGHLHADPSLNGRTLERAVGE